MTSLSQTQMQRRKSAGRLKLSRELMIRLTMALDARKHEPLVAAAAAAGSRSQVGGARRACGGSSRRAAGAEGAWRRSDSGESDNTLRVGNLNSADHKSCLKWQPQSRLVGSGRGNRLQKTTGLPLSVRVGRGRFALAQVRKRRRRREFVICNRKERQVGQNGISLESGLVGCAPHPKSVDAAQSGRLMGRNKAAKWLEAAESSSVRRTRLADDEDQNESSTLLATRRQRRLRRRRRRRSLVYRKKFNKNSSVIQRIEGVERVRLGAENHLEWAHVLSFAQGDADLSLDSEANPSSAEFELDKEEENLDPLQLNLNRARSGSRKGNKKQSSKLNKRTKLGGRRETFGWPDCNEKTRRERSEFEWELELGFGFGLGVGSRFESGFGSGSGSESESESEAEAEWELEPRGSAGGSEASEKCDTGSRWARAGRPPLRLLWLLALLLLLLGPPLLRPVGRVSGQSTSDELSRAVLATMSTQSPADSARANRTAGEEAAAADVRPADAFERVMEFWRIFVMGAIIVGDICGNSLVILSVCRHSKLRVTTNWFVVSLACADILVALFAMTFNASVIISGRWLFKPWVCDFWNSCDVLASTASILHLCCISIDRYIAITRPLDYPMKITTRRVVYALCAVWIASALLSYIPIFTGVYTTQEHIQWLQDNPDQCEFVVNRVYAVVSSSISFWIPSSIMVFTYYRIYREATRQEKFIYKTQSMMPAPVANHQLEHSSGAHRAKQRRSKSMALVSSGAHGPAHANNEARIRQLARQQREMSAASKLHAATRQHQLDTASVATTNLNCAPALTLSRAAGADCEPPSGPQGGVSASSALLEARGNGAANSVRPGSDTELELELELEEAGSNSGQSTPTKRSQTVAKMKREHKAAKTLGIIMGVFILCWLPFFSWYTPQHICGHACDGMVPRGAVTILFWIGYFNSTLNPIIYAYFNHEFRDAFKKTLQWIFCCCNDLKCLRVNRPNDNQHYNCTYRSTQEIGLVSNS